MSFRRFSANQKIACASNNQEGKNGGGRGGGGGGRGGTFCSTSNKFLLVARLTLTTGLQKCLESWHSKLRGKFTVSPRSIVKKVRTGSKNSQGT